MAYGDKKPISTREGAIQPGAPQPGLPSMGMGGRAMPSFPLTGMAPMDQRVNGMGGQTFTSNDPQMSRPPGHEYFSGYASPPPYGFVNGSIGGLPIAAYNREYGISPNAFGRMTQRIGQLGTTGHQINDAKFNQVFGHFGIDPAAFARLRAAFAQRSLMHPGSSIDAMLRGY